jgi:RNA polymerase sigma factor (sigma-70 family)
MATAPPQADAVLVGRLRERDPTAWAELYDEHGPRLRGFAYRLTGNPHDADDLVQETFVRALPRLDRIDPDRADLGPYLHTTLRNLFLKSVERGRRSRPVAEVPETDDPVAIEDDPERGTLLHSQQEEVRAANARLAPRQRLVLALRELEDRSYAEIGVVVGLNENAVAQLISRARESLRHELRLAQVDPGRLPEECRLNLPLLSRHLDGQLRGAQLERTLAHLEGCERCQEALDSMREAQRRYRLLPPLLFTGDELRKRIDVELTSAGYWDGPSSRLRRPAALAAAVAALLAVGGSGVGAALLIRDDAPSRLAAASTEPAATTARPPTTEPPPRTTAAPSTAAPPATTRSAPTTSAATTTAEATSTAPPPAATSPSTTAAVAPPPPTVPVVPPPAVTAVTPTADTVAPTVTLLSRPAAQTASPTASFSFQASEAGATFSCRLDGGAYGACTSPRAFAGLAVGVHEFAVRARDRAGNTGPPATARWTIVPPPDTVPPTATIVAATTAGADATFQFTASEPGSSFACSLDGAAYAACASPRAYAGLAPGAHAFSVRATDTAGNTGPPATHAWTIVPPPPPPPPLPDLVVSALSRTGFSVTNIGTAAAGPFVVSVTLIGTFTIPGLAPGQTVTRTWSICRTGTITAIADRGAAVAESDERNNTRSIVNTC